LKKAVILAIVLAVVFVSLGALAAFAAVDNSKANNAQDTIKDAKKIELTDAQKKEIEGILTQIGGLQKQLVDKYVEFGVITKERADAIKKAIDKKAEIAKEKGYTFTPRAARRGLKKFCPRGNCPKPQEPAAQSA